MEGLFVLLFLCGSIIVFIAGMIFESKAELVGIVFAVLGMVIVSVLVWAVGDLMQGTAIPERNMSQGIYENFGTCSFRGKTRALLRREEDDSMYQYELEKPLPDSRFLRVTVSGSRKVTIQPLTETK